MGLIKSANTAAGAPAQDGLSASAPPAKRAAKGARAARPTERDLEADLAASDPEIRRQAALAAAARPGRGELTPALATALAQERVRAVQIALLGALAASAGPAERAALASLLRHPDAWLRNGAMLALHEIGPEACAELAPLLEDGDADMRIAALATLAGLATPETAGAVIALCARETDAKVASAAIECLGQIGGAAAIPALRGLAARFTEDPFMPFAAAAIITRLEGAG